MTGTIDDQLEFRNSGPDPHFSYHAINPKHLPRYLAEFCYRHNRRFQLEDMIPRFAYVAVTTPPMPSKLLKLAEAYG